MNISNNIFQRLKDIFVIFFKISLFTVGGGLAMLPAMSREFVENRAWLTDEDMVDVVAVVQSMPGIIAINMAIMVGYRVAGIPGVIAASIGVSLPPFLVILLIAMFMRQLSASETMNHIFIGVRSAVCAMILLSVFKLYRQIIKNFFAFFVAVSGFICLVFFRMDAILLIVAGAFAGMIYSAYIRIATMREKTSGEGAE